MDENKNMDIKIKMTKNNKTVNDFSPRFLNLNTIIV